MDKLQRAYDKLDLEVSPIKDKVRQMLELGEITPSMIDFEFYNEDDLEVAYKSVFADGTTDTTETTYEIEISVIVRNK